ncbi:hypothetical protein [Aeromonas salmonicida]|uniref:hypothetical protein n=1 Tax=Aeromonas salmonicida TaxID=645 RepID=UPI0038B79541
MNGLLTTFKKLYHICAFLSLLGVVLIFIFAVDIPVYNDEPFTDGNGITWVKYKGVTHGYQLSETNTGAYNLKIYELDKHKKSSVVNEGTFKIDLPLASPLKSSDFSSYDGRQVILHAPITINR